MFLSSGITLKSPSGLPTSWRSDSILTFQLRGLLSYSGQSVLCQLPISDITQRELRSHHPVLPCMKLIRLNNQQLFLSLFREVSSQGKPVYQILERQTGEWIDNLTYCSRNPQRKISVRTSAGVANYKWQIAEGLV